MLVVEGVVQQEDVGDFEIQGGQLPAQLLERMGTQAPGNQGSKVFGTQLDLDRSTGVEREGHIVNGTEMMADRTVLAIGLFDQWIAFPHREGFHAVGAERFADDAIPPP